MVLSVSRYFLAMSVSRLSGELVRLSGELVDDTSAVTIGEPHLNVQSWICRKSLTRFSIMPNISNVAIKLDHLTHAK
jgi:hypothetical protein